MMKAVRIPAKVVVTALALTACDGAPDADSRAALDHVARAVERGEDHVRASEIAAWRIEGRSDLAVLDVRSRADYDAGHVDGARHVPLISLVGEAELERLAGMGTVVVYANDTDRAAQAAVMLRLAAIDAYSLEGGYGAWRQMLADPVAGVDDPEGEEARERIAVSCFFAADYDRAAGFTRGAGYVPPLQPTCDAATRTDAAILTAPAPAPTPAPTPAPEGASDAPEEELELIVEEGC